MYLWVFACIYLANVEIEDVRHPALAVAPARKEK
jgi:hypothetical protein